MSEFSLQPTRMTKLPREPHEVWEIRISLRDHPKSPGYNPHRELLLETAARNGYYGVYEQTVASYFQDRLEPLAHGAGGDVVTEVFGFIAAGVVGNASYDALKKVAMAYVHADKNVPQSLTSEEAALRARTMIVERWHLPNLATLKLVEEVRFGEGRWLFEFRHGKDRFRVESLDDDGAVFVARRLDRK